MRNLLSKFKRMLFVPLLICSLFSVVSCSSSVSISESNISMYVDDTYDLTASSSDEDALVLWRTSDKTVAVVRRGKITAVGKGECDITAYDDNGATASCHVLVDAVKVSVSHASKDVDLKYLNTFLLRAEAEDNGDVSWSSSNERLATVSSEGLVTCFETGDVTITAYRKGGKGSCAVSIIDSGRSVDYYEMQEGKNSVVASDPGVWYYWQNDGSKVSKAVYQAAGFTSSISTLSGQGVFYRYQPGGKDETGLNVGDRYNISFEIMLNVTGSVRGKKTVNVTANQWTSYSYSGTVSSSEPFYFSIRDLEMPSSGSIEVSVRNIHVGDDHASDYYQIASGNNATCVSTPGKWFYWANGSDKVKNAYYENKTVNIAIEKLNDAQGMYFRYQPGGNDGTGLNVGDEYTLSLDITMNVAGTFTGKSTATVTTPNQFVKYQYEGTVSADSPFQITLKGVTVPEGGTINVTMKNISIVKKGAPIGDTYDIEKGNNATCVANPGRWYYWTNGSDSVSSAAYDAGVVSISIDKLNDAQGIYFRYQPGAADGLSVGDEYTITLQATMNVVGTFSGKATAAVTTPGEFVQYQCTGTVSADSPFQITLKGVTVPENGTIDVTFKDIVISKGSTPTPPPVEAYDLEKGNNATCVANPGKWYYWTNGSDTVSSATWTEGKVEVSIDKLDDAAGIYFRYQPGGSDGTGLEVGDEYTITLQATMNIAGTFSGKSTATVTTPNEFVQYQYTGVVEESAPFQIILKDVAVPENGTIDVEFKNISIVKNVPIPDVFYNLEKGNNATCVANPGIWYYWSNGSDSVASATYTDGVIEASIDKLNDAQGMYFRYQPGGSDGTGLNVGDEYTIDFDITMSQPGTVQGKSTATVSTAWEYAHYSYQGNVGDSQPFNFTIKGMTVPDGGTIDIKVKNIVVQKVIHVPSAIPFGTQADAIANPGVWHLDLGAGDVVASTALEGQNLTVELSQKGTAGTTLYYQPGAEASNGLLLGDKYTISYTITANSVGTIGGSSTYEIEASNNPVNQSYSAVINGSSAFAINLKDLVMPDSGNLSITISNLKFKSLPQGTMAVVRENPGVWHYNSAGSATFNVVPRTSNDLNGGSIGVEMKSFATDHFYFRYQPGGSDGTGCQIGDSFRLSFKIASSIAATFAYGTSGEQSVSVGAGESVAVVYEGTVSNNIFYVKLDKSLACPIAVTLSEITVEKI